MRLEIEVDRVLLGGIVGDLDRVLATGIVGDLGRVLEVGTVEAAAGIGVKDLQPRFGWTEFGSRDFQSGFGGASRPGFGARI
ncbi:hypothetical protein L3X38_033568 [Prunus dulcis]|uniref:Uncharacterized protein n=1 Tax=Prunus dulcis TaxID=3755 RepID=A0AAD4VG66_PRUDU|nr:hypothetical protein L3X38_033568 [Prunus dulcis]